MIEWLVGAWVVKEVLGIGKEQAKPQEAKPQGAPDPMALQCPTDAHMPPEGVHAVRTCYLHGSREQLEQFAGALGLQFPVARNSLLSRAFELQRAIDRKAAGPAPASAVVTTPPAPSPPMSKEEAAKAEAEAAIKVAQNGRSGAQPLDGGPAQPAKGGPTVAVG